MEEIAGRSFAALVDRHDRRLPVQKHQFSILPDRDVDLISLRSRIITEYPPERPQGSRSNINSHWASLRYSFREQSELLALHALSVSYLRRSTPFTHDALYLFRRIWSEQNDFMLEHIDARWLISALQTFYDHPETAGERTAGGMGFMYGNLIKVYETERAAEARGEIRKDAKFRNRSFRGLYGFKPGDDIFANLHVLLYDASLDGGLAGAPLLRFMEMAAENEIIFSRMDALSDTPPFSDHPSYTLSFGGRSKTAVARRRRKEIS